MTNTAESSYRITPGVDAGDREPSSALSVTVLVSLLWRHRRLIVGCAVAAAIVVAGICLVLPRHYTATASFVPQQRRTLPAAGLAAQFGLTLPGNSAESPQFYVDLLRSRQILGPTVDTRYSLRDGGRVATSTLSALYGKAGDDSIRRRDRAITRLRRDMMVTTTSRTDVVTIAVTARDPYLARDIVDHLLQEVNAFNVSKRQSQGSAERRFTEGRLQEASADLKVAENQLQDFLQNNRLFNSPRLEFERDRLQREIGMRQQVYTTLAQAYQQAKIEEVRDSPVITIIESPEAPPTADSRQVVQRALLALIAGGLLAGLFVLGREYRTLSALAERERVPGGLSAG